MYTEPEQGVFNYTGGDYFLNIAERTGKIVRCHNLVWVSELPDWVNNGNWTAETLNAVMENHITNLIEHWGDKCYSWDVVNEALNGDGTFSSSIWYDTIGEDYFYNAFAAATKAVKKTGKDIKLYYNDYGLENPGTKTTAAYNLVKELRKRGSKIDGVGLESHFEVGLTPSTADQVAAKQGFIDLGLEVAITELDVRFTQAPYYDLAGEYQQSLDYASAVASCVEVGPKCVGITVWDFVDTYSWVPASFAGQGGATLLNDTYQRKPSWNSVAGALLGWQ
ncbi:hypothetical protein DH86_00003926 [Scytalidium sp. 3C]|nr:hypothetical protein DH86_00003926 [Scytalidium sp. 3C]